MSVREAVKAPLGYKWQDNKLIVDRGEQELISIVRGYISLGISLDDVAQKLTNANFSGRQGQAVFTVNMVKSIYAAGEYNERN